MTRKVLFLSFDRVPGVGSVGQHLARLIPELAERYEVDALSLKRGEMAHIQRLGQARMMRVPVPEDDDVECVAAFRRAVARQLDSDSYDCVYCTDLFSAHAVATHENAGGLTTIADLFDLPAVSFDERYGFYAGDQRAQQELIEQEQEALAASTRVIVHSEAMLRTLAERGADRSKIELIRPGVDTDLFAAPSIEVRAEPHAFLVAGIVEPVRRPFLESLVQVLSKAPKRLQLRLIGESLDREVVDALTARHNVQRRVHMERPGTAEELATLLGNVDVVAVCWGYTEATMATGIVPVEMLNALACGRPVVVTRSPGVREVIGGSEAGILCDLGDTAGLAKAFTELEASSALRKRMGTRGREMIQDRHAWEHVLPELIAVVEEVLGGEPARARAGADRDGLTPHTAPRPAAAAPEVEVMHTPIVARPRPAQPLPAEAPPSRPVVPEPIALGVDEEVSPDAQPMDPWAHDTIATPTSFDEEPPTLDTGIPGSIPGLRSVAIMDDVPTRNIHDEETEIRPRDGGGALGMEEQTERVVIGRDLADRLRQQPSLPRSLIDEEETVRMPAFDGADTDAGPAVVPPPEPGSLTVDREDTASEQPGRRRRERVNTPGGRPRKKR